MSAACCAGHAPKPVSIEPVSPGAIYTCPMHPEVRQVGPGHCPKCGMALEPQVPSVDTDDGGELRAMSHRFVLLLALTLPVFVLAMGPHLAGWQWPAPWSGLAGWIEAVFASVVVLWGGAPFFARGWRSLRPWSPNMYTLIALGTGVAWVYSAVAFLLPAAFPPTMRNMHGGIDVYFESAAVIVTLVTLGDWLEFRARRRTGAALRALLSLAPKSARRIHGTHEMDVPLDSLVRGDVVRIRPGETVPLDGVVLEGTSHVDEAMLSGEPLPVPKKSGDAVTGGTQNRDGALTMRVERVGADTVLARIVALVAEAQRSRAPLQRIADRVAAWFVPAVAAIAALAFVAWMFLGPEPRFSHALVAAVSVLIVACPCALGLATPISIMVASGRGAGIGVLFRDATAIERLRAVDTLVVDKTGTLTEGRPALGEVVVETIARERALALAAALERGSEHPLARAIVEAAEAEVIVLPPAEAVRMATGLGVTGNLGGDALALGNATLMDQVGASLSASLREQAETLRAAGATMIFLGVRDKVVAAFAIVDRIRSGTPAALDALRASGIDIVMLTGDSATTARAVASTLGIDTVHAETSPADKAAVIAALKAAGRCVAMVGDGINDAPALATADVGIGMGGGTDIAIASASVALLRADLGGVVRARRLSVATVRNIRQNLFFAFVYNAVGVPVAAGVLYPVFGVTLSPMIAALAMSLSSVSVVVNALRLRS